MWWQPIVAFLILTCIYFSFYDELEYYPGFFAVTIVIQYFCSMGLTACTFNTRNALAILLMTLAPWVLIFGVMLVCVHNIAPDLKFLFANVYGYMYVSSAATKLVQQNLQHNTELSKKIYKDPSRFINYINQANFEETYDQLVKETTTELQPSFKEELLKLVKSRETIGIAAWYIHTGILAICIVQSYMSTYVCK